MKGSRFSEEQIVGVLKEAEAGVPMKDLCRRIGISTATFYHWKAKYGGMEVSETDTSQTTHKPMDSGVLLSTSYDVRTKRNGSGAVEPFGRKIAGWGLTPSRAGIITSWRVYSGLLNRRGWPLILRA